MTQAQAVEYDKPRVTETVNAQLEGTLTRILRYEFMRSSESIPGSGADRSDTTTTFCIEDFRTRMEHAVEFKGFVGAEVVNQQVMYADTTKEKITFFNPKGRENDPSYRRSKKEIERVQILSPKDAKLPPYVSKQTSLNSL